MHPALIFLKFIPLRVYIIAAIGASVAGGIWYVSHLRGVIGDYKKAVRVQQATVTGNKELVEDLSSADDQLMYDSHKRAEEAHARFMRWLYQQTPPTDGKIPSGYTEHMNEVR